MASISCLCPNQRVRRRDDLVARPIPELGLCMVYRPRPAKIISLNMSGWLLLNLCDGSKIGEIESAFLDLLRGSGRQVGSTDAQLGLCSLIEHELISAQPNGRQSTRARGGENEQ